MKKSDVVVPKGMEMAYEQFHFAPAVRAGKWLRCAGQLGTNEKFEAIAEPEAQFVQAFENVKTVLTAAGLGFADIVEMTTFHVGLRKHLGAFLAVKDRYMEAPHPAWTAIGIVELAVPDALVEIRVTAQLRNGKPAKAKKSRKKKSTAKRGGARKRR